MCMNSGCPYAIPHVASNHDPHTRTLLLRNVRLSGTPDDASAVGRLYNVTCVDGKVAHVAETDSSANENLQRNGDVDQGEDIAQMLDAKGLGILLPGYELRFFVRLLDIESHYFTPQTMSCTYPP